MNYWKQLNHVMKWFRVEEEPKARLPNNFMTGFLEVGCGFPVDCRTPTDIVIPGPKLG